MKMTKMLSRAVTATAVLMCLVSCGGNDSSPTPPPPAQQSQQTITDYIKGNFTSVSKGSLASDQGWRDPSGVVWANVMLVDLTPRQVAASTVCANFNEVPPTRQQLDQLMIYLGRGTAFGFHPEDLQKAFNQGVGWGPFENTLILGTDSIDDDGSIVGINGNDGTGLVLMNPDPSTLDSTGSPFPYENPVTDLSQLNFAALCIFN